MNEVEAAHEISGGSAGARTIADIVTTNGTQLSRYRASNIMKKLGLVSCQIKQHRYKKGTKEHINIPNTLDRQFAVTEPNQVWCGDVTYVWSGQQWLYLAVVIDLFSRRVIGWATSKSPSLKPFQWPLRPEEGLKESCSIQIKVVIIQVNSSGNFCGAIK